MAKGPDDFDEVKVHELILATQEVIKALQEEVTRLRSYLELSALKAPTANEHLLENLRRSDESLRKCDVHRKELQEAIESAARARRKSG